MGSQWPGMGRDLMTVDVFHDSIERSHKVIQAVDPSVDVYRLLTNGHLTESNTTINNFVGIASIQVGICTLDSNSKHKSCALLKALYSFYLTSLAYLFHSVSL